MRWAFLILIVIVACACNPASKESLSKPLENPHILRAGGVTMRMSGVFVQSDFAHLGKLWDNSGLSEELIFRKINDLQELDSFQDGPTFIFSDTTNFRNIFVFTEASYLDVEEGNEEKMFTEFESVMKEASKREHITTYELVENDFFSLSNGDKVYKMSYKTTYLGETEYATTYFIATKTRIVRVEVRNVADDCEATVQSMNIDRYFYVDPLPDNE